PFRPRIGMAPQHPRTSLPEVPIEPDAHIAARTSAVSASTVLLDPIGDSEPFAVLESAAFLGSLEGLGSLQAGRRASVSLESGQRAAVAVAERAAVPLDSMPEASASVTAESGPADSAGAVEPVTRSFPDPQDLSTRVAGECAAQADEEPAPRASLRRRVSRVVVTLAAAAGGALFAATAVVADDAGAQSMAAGTQHPHP
ncbi:MAG: hypothetical protein J2P18_19940, partial [Nocardia sp.]|nr:hypothetical protein [Nocardia sp.]